LLLLLVRWDISGCIACKLGMDLICPFIGKVAGWASTGVRVRILMIVDNHCVARTVKVV